MSSSKRTSDSRVADDPYLYPGTSTLRNLRGLRDPDQLQKFEGEATLARLLQLQERPIVGNFDRAHLQAIHKHIFQDVYEWAGKLRTVEIAKPGSPFFAFERFLVPSLDKLSAQLKAQGQLRGLAADDFAMRAGHYLSELNAIHPFREGNGRTQQEFVRELGLKAGHRIEWANVSREQMYAASKVSFEHADSSGLAAVLGIAIVSHDTEHAAFIRQTIHPVSEETTDVARDRTAITKDATAILTAKSPTAHIIEDGVGSREITGEVIATSALHAAIATSATSFAIVDRGALDVARSRAQEVSTQLRPEVVDPLQPPPRRQRL